MRTAGRVATSDIWADALFASMLQRSDDPGPDRVWRAIVTAVWTLGRQGCADLVAQEFGDHPEIAVRRMRWARSVTDKLFRPSVLSFSGACLLHQLYRLHVLVWHLARFAAPGDEGLLFTSSTRSPLHHGNFYRRT